MLILTKDQCIRLIKEAPEAVYFISAIYVVENEMSAAALSSEEYDLFVSIVKGTKGKDGLISYQELQDQSGVHPGLYDNTLSQLAAKNIIYCNEVGVKLAILEQSISLPISNDPVLSIINLTTAAFKLALFMHATQLLKAKRGEVQEIAQPALPNIINPRQLHFPEVGSSLPIPSTATATFSYFNQNNMAAPDPDQSAKQDSKQQDGNSRKRKR